MMTHDEMIVLSRHPFGINAQIRKQRQRRVMSDFDEWFIGSEDVLDKWEKDNYEMVWDAAQAKQREACAYAVQNAIDTKQVWEEDRTLAINACLNAVEKSAVPPTHQSSYHRG